MLKIADWRSVRRAVFAVAAAALTGIAAAATAQPAKAPYDGDQRTSFYVAVRDGTRLAVDLFRPTRNGAPASEKLPVVWMHTPYNRRVHAAGNTAEHYPPFARQLVKHGYNVAMVDFRGQYASFGRGDSFNRGAWTPAAWWDAYDLTEWLARQPWSSGKVGMVGCSATGSSAVQAAVTAPPSLKAIMPLSYEFDIYDFSVHGGVSRGTSFGAELAFRDGGQAGRDAAAVPVDGPEGPELLRAAIAEHAQNVQDPGVIPFRDSPSPAFGVPQWWIRTSPHTYLDVLKRSGIGIYTGFSWDEPFFKVGPPRMFRNLAPNTRLTLAPFSHCEWAKVRTETGFDIVEDELRFFDHWLKGADNGAMKEPPVTYYTYNAPDGRAWRKAASWPLPNEVRTDFYLGPKALGRARPREAGRDAAGLSQPYAWRGLAGGPGAPVGEQTLVYLTEPLAADVEVTGHPSVRLWIASELPDVDVVAGLAEVAPDGTVRSHNMFGQLRASHRTLARAPYDNLGLPWRSHLEKDARPLPGGQPVELAFELLPMSYVFRAGHRIRLTVMFNDPTGSKPSDSARVSILRDARHPSRLTLPVVP